jgi:hypothetical protein
LRAVVPVQAKGLNASPAIDRADYAVGRATNRSYKAFVQALLKVSGAAFCGMYPRAFQ